MFVPEKKLFRDISSANIDTLVPSLYQCVETHSIQSVDLSQLLSHLRFNLFVISETFLDPVVNCFTRQTLPHRKQETFLY
jgi:hypothetical protein